MNLIGRSDRSKTRVKDCFSILGDIYLSFVINPPENFLSYVIILSIFNIIINTINIIIILWNCKILSGHLDITNLLIFAAKNKHLQKIVKGCKGMCLMCALLWITGHFLIFSYLT